MIRLFFLTAALLLVTPIYATAGGHTAFKACAQEKNDIARLQCFDKQVEGMLSPSAASSPQCVQMKLIDLQLDIERLAGKCIRTNGQVMTMGGMVMISRGHMANPLIASADDLPRDQRKLLLNCKTACRMNVEGYVESIMFQSGIRLTNISR